MYAYLFKTKGVQVREASDDTLRIDLIPNRLAELRRNPWSKANQKRIDALLVRQGFAPEGLTRQEKKAFVPTLKKIEMNGAVEFATPEGMIPKNVFAGMMVSGGDEKRGYAYKAHLDGSLESAMARLGLKTA